MAQIECSFQWQAAMKKMGIHIERQQKCLRDLEVQMLLTQLLLNSNFLMPIDLAFYRTRTIPMGAMVAQWVMWPSSQLQGLWFDPDLGLLSRQNFPFSSCARGPVHTWYYNPSHVI